MLFRSESVSLTSETLARADCTVIITGHKDIDYKWIVNETPLVVDTINATRNVIENRHKIMRLGAPLQLH